MKTILTLVEALKSALDYTGPMLDRDRDGTDDLESLISGALAKAENVEL